LDLGTTALKQSKYGDPPKKTQTIAVLGAGLMGAGELSLTRLPTHRGEASCMHGPVCVT
jgi:hypothetical protein